MESDRLPSTLSRPSTPKIATLTIRWFRAILAAFELILYWETFPVRSLFKLPNLMTVAAYAPAPINSTRSKINAFLKNPLFFLRFLGKVSLELRLRSSILCGGRDGREELLLEPWL